MSDYKKTLNLPKTSFPMKANLKDKEPQTLKAWEKMDAYGRMVKANEDAPRFVLHDGPPYANGHIHMGTALNKVLKDIIVKHKNLRGFKAEYIPGWDCHGLPIEHKVAQELREKGKTDLPAVTVRKICRDYAGKWLKTQRGEFKRLGVLGVWNDPYMTMAPAYEAATARELGRFMENGGVYRGKKPIHWCIDCQTALAEAEVEYADHTSPSIYVAFPIQDPKLTDKLPQAAGLETSVVIWTTTPWTIPSNMAVALHADFEYALIKTGPKNAIIVAKELAADLCAKFGVTDMEILAIVSGAELEGVEARHPLIDRPSPMVLADYVTLDAGTGAVHTAPGHGREDYETGLRYGLDILSPLTDEGRYQPVVGIDSIVAKTIFEANPEVIELLEAAGALLAQDKVSHSYPHCWRCKKPVIFRATTQWFISMQANDLRGKALGAINNDVRWIPAWGRERIHSMIENRPDWCISRQRTWGVPIVALVCKDCDHAYFDAQWVYSIVDRFAAHERGCDYWFEADISEVVPQGLTCPECGSANWDKEDDILDVWFDSGTSFAAVVEQRPECRFPADMYLEGSDQHRGWFHSSLLASVGNRGVPPYKAVLTHGYVVDGEGKKMSKSIGNTIAPQEIIDQYGAEILRLWVSAVNYQEDIRISGEILGRLVDAYRRIRNTSRFLLGNLAGFTPDKAVAFADMDPLDQYALSTVRQAFEQMIAAYDGYEFHKVYHILHNLCATDLSAFYLDVVKDRLYVSAADDVRRRSTQTVMWKTLCALTQAMAPVMSFTAEEVFGHLPQALRPAGETVFESRFAFEDGEALSADAKANMDLALQIRAEAIKAIEPLRKAGKLGHSLEAHVTLHADQSLLDKLTATGLELRELFIVSEVTLTTEPLPSPLPPNAVKAENIDGLSISVATAAGEKCERCWVVDARTGEDENHPGTCPRCARVLAGLGQGE